MTRPRITALWCGALACLLAAIALGLHAGPAAADADPASDTLLVQDAFYPYSPPTPASLQAALESSLRRLRTAGLDLKVAVIASPVDLGGIPALFGRPGRYARFLDTEITARGARGGPPLLVVMPQGVAAQNTGPSGAVAGITVERGAGAAGLVRTAIEAIRRIAAARGVTIAPVERSSTGGGGLSVALLGGAALVLVLLAAAAALRGRAGTRRSDAAARR